MAIAVAEKRQLIEPGHPHVSIRRQGAWLGLARGSVDDHPGRESVETLQLMRLRRRGEAVHPQRVRRRRRPMSREAI